MYFYIKALHIIFIVTWFSGLFYIVRLFVYQAESNLKPEPERSILLQQLGIMSRRLWLGITWPSAILTLLFGSLILWLFGSVPVWLWVKLGFVAGLYAYHFSLHHIYQQHQQGRFPYTSQQLRMWNELATVFLVAVVLLVVVKQELSALWGLLGLAVFIGILLLSIQIYKCLRNAG
ncbi:protoporphyrinogen IX oxidase [Sphingobacteriales bacterium UPWRP_1]|nr:protoporphyrinogen IX oxidase [Sphingobacteriales bacterium TSM_CSS]PSJ75285.1 protoporphyrinogen IX oxidase [Sphingobacteriales bacterium UPWRP_1]